MLIFFGGFSKTSNNYAQALVKQKVSKENIAVLKADKDIDWIFNNNEQPVALTKNDFKVIEQLLQKLIQEHNQQGNATFSIKLVRGLKIQNHQKASRGMLAKIFGLALALANVSGVGRSQSYRNCGYTLLATGFFSISIVSHSSFPTFTYFIGLSV